MTFACQHDVISLFLSLTPSVFTILMISVWGGVDAYINREAATVASTERLAQEQLDQVVALARSSVALQNFIASVLNTLISVLVVIATFPEGANPFIIVLVLLAALMLFFVKWITKIMSFRLYELANTLVPYSALSRKVHGKKLRKVTYAQLLTYHELALLFTIVIVICVGYALNRCMWV